MSMNFSVPASPSSIVISGGESKHNAIVRAKANAVSTGKPTVIMAPANILGASLLPVALAKPDGTVICNRTAETLCGVE